MLNRANPTEEQKSLLTALPIGAAGQAAVLLYEKITSDEYSEYDIKRLTELKHIYQEVLQNTAPLSWELDNSKKPTHRFSPHQWSNHVQQLKKGKHKIGHFHYQSSLIAEYAATYLAARGKRWGFAKGRQGDLLEQFMGEWIHFSIHELSTFDYNDASIKKIEQRIKYLEKIQKHEFIFKFGTITRNKNKFDTMQNIKQQLYSSVELALKESLRQCAREKLDLCRSNTTGLLLASANAMYYSRATVTYHEPFDLTSFLNPSDNFLSASAKTVYSRVKKTHSGAMLQEFISLAGLDVFSAQETDLRYSREPLYFNKDFSPKTINWRSKALDLPPWIKPEVAISYMRNHQKMAQSALRVAKLKHLLEVAYDLTGNIGDLWAYGDAQGKLSLNALLFLLGKELDTFYTCFKKIYHYQNKKRQDYNLEYSVNPDHDLNKNFNKVDQQYEDITKFYDSLKEAITNIHDRMANFTEEEAKKIDLQKKGFYKSVANYIEQYHPKDKDYDKYRSLETASNKEAEPGENSEDLNVTEPDISEEFYCFDRQSKTSKEILKNEDFKTWKKDFANRHKEDHLELQNLKLQFRKNVDSQISIEEIVHSALALKNHVDLLKSLVEYERPVWSFRSLGWPFHRKKRAYVNLLVSDLDFLLKEIAPSIGGEELFKNTQTPSSRSSTQTINIVIELAAANDKKSKAPSPKLAKTTGEKEVLLKKGVKLTAEEPVLPATPNLRP